ncbi:MAG: S8 family serine peptidase [Candidatus Kerfeldbacteria bacterium]|nr:S8 family serine peptidase [Candidatus Kerfeldbacteria bacterium]
MIHRRRRWWLVLLAGLLAVVFGLMIWRWSPHYYTGRVVDLAGNPLADVVVVSSFDQVNTDQTGYFTIQLARANDSITVGSGDAAVLLDLDEDPDATPPSIAELDALFGDSTNSSLTTDERAQLVDEITQGYYPDSSMIDTTPVIVLPIVNAPATGLPPPMDPTTIITNEEAVEVVQGEILVGWSAELTAEQRAMAVAAAGGTMRYDDATTLTSIVYVADQTQVPGVVSALQHTAGVTGALQNYLLEPDAASFAPTDPDYTDKNKSWWLRTMNLEPAWQMTKGSSTIVVAVIDAGFELDHPDLVGAFTKTTLNFSTTALNATPRHGTHVSGIIAARQNNDEGLTGIAPQVRVLPIKINDLARLPQVFNTLQQWPGVRIASMSMGWGWRKKNIKRTNAGLAPFTQQFMQQTSAALDAIIRPSFQQYYRGGGVFCKSAGNDWGYDSQLNGLNYNEVITVAAGNATGAITNFSNIGAQVDVTAPGYKIWSTVESPKRYEYLSGTSMSTPAVCATTALVRSLRPKFGALLVKKILEKSSVEPNNNVDAWRALLRTTKRFGVTGTVIDEDMNFVMNADVTMQPAAWYLTTNNEGDYIVPYLQRINRTLLANKGEAKGKESITPPPLAGDEVLELVFIELSGKDDENTNESSNTNNLTNNDTNSTNTDTTASDGADTTDSVDDDVTVLDNGIVVSATGCAVSGFTVPPAEGDCAPGFYFSRETIACEQIQCPAGVGRTYTLECKCEGEGYQAIYACAAPGYMVACIQK